MSVFYCGSPTESVGFGCSFHLISCGPWTTESGERIVYRCLVSFDRSHRPRVQSGTAQSDLPATGDRERPPQLDHRTALGCWQTTAAGPATTAAAVLSRGDDTSRLVILIHQQLSAAGGGSNSIDATALQQRQWGLVGAVAASGSSHTCDDAPAFSCPSSFHGSSYSAATSGTPAQPRLTVTREGSGTCSGSCLVISVPF